MGARKYLGTHNQPTPSKIKTAADQRSSVVDPLLFPSHPGAASTPETCGIFLQKASVGNGRKCNSRKSTGTTSPVSFRPRITGPDQLKRTHCVVRPLSNEWSGRLHSV